MFRRGTKLSNKISKMRAYGFFQPIGQTAIPGLNFAFSSIQTNEAFVLVIEVPVAAQSLLFWGTILFSQPLFHIKAHGIVV